MHLRRHQILKPAKDIGKLCEENYTILSKDIKDDQKKKKKIKRGFPGGIGDKNLQSLVQEDSACCRAARLDTAIAEA